MARPHRTCVGCRRTADQAELLRFTLDGQTGTVLLDQRHRAPGRGAYVHPDADCISAAIRRRAVPRALRAPQCNTTVLSGLATAYAKSAEIE
jgi:predicted RNA-binding protein YlxR (DUF448 family)